MTIKKLLLLLVIVPLVFAIQSCGKGAGEGYTPPGSGPGDPVYVKLKPARYAAQTNGCIDFYAEVHDAQGELLANIPVTFTNLSEPLGVILDRCGGIEIHTPVNTDSWGRAKITIMSTTPGFVTVLAQTTLGSQPRDRKTVLYSFCSTYDCLVLAPSLQLDVDSVPGDGIYNEPSDFIIFEPPPDPDNTVELLATVRNKFGVLIQDAAITWGSDHAEAVFTRTEDYTNANGQAQGIVLVTPQSLRDTDTHVTVWAMATNVSSFYYPYNVVTLFLRPVFISSITVTADPSIVAPGGNSTITATLTLNTGLGDPVPDGVTVVFTTCDAATCTMPCGIVEPFAQTTGGQASVQFTAPPIPDTCRVTARVNATTGFTDILVTTALTVTPDSIDVNGTVGGTATFTVTGGVAPYTVVSDSSNTLLDPVLSPAGDSFTVTVPAGTESQTVTYIIRDSVSDEVTATVAISTDALAVLPPTQTLINPVAGDTATYTIYGGVVDAASAYTAFSSYPTFVSVAVAGQTLIATVDVVPLADTTVTITIADDLGATVTATLRLDVPAAVALTVTPPTSSVSCSSATGIDYLIVGGIAPYTAISTSADITITPASPLPAATFNATPSGCAAFPAASTPVSLIVQDSGIPPSTATVVLTVTNP